MRNAFVIAVSGLTVGVFCGSVAAQQLPKSGTISVHSGYWAVDEAVNVAEKTVQGHGNNRGIAFNDKAQVHSTLALQIASTRFLLLLTTPK
jgi:hypothetical protein